MTTAGPTSPPLPAREAYRLWAPTYREETAVSALDRWAVAEIAPSPAGNVLLDAGCGTGRRLEEARAAGALRALGVDLVHAMIRGGGAGAARACAVADVRALPFPDGTFDLAWCRLVLGHLADPAPAYREMARVLRPGGALVVTDFHPEAARAGHLRTFHDADGKRHVVEHHVHEADDHRRGAAAAGLVWDTALDAPVGPPILEHYRAAGALERYRRDEGLPLVLAMTFRK